MVLTAQIAATRLNKPPSPDLNIAQHRGSMNCLQIYSGYKNLPHDVSSRHTATVAALLNSSDNIRRVTVEVGASLTYVTSALYEPLERFENEQSRGRSMKTTISMRWK